jgi:hypothetical protein
MGTFARTGIINRFSLHENSVKHLSNSIDEAVEIAAKNVVANPGVFDHHQEDGYHTWKLNKTIKEKHLLELVRKYYTDIYGEDSGIYKRDCKNILEFLETNPSENELEAWAEKNWRDVFSMYDNDELYLFLKDKRVRVAFSSIRLSMEGKVLYEMFEGHLNFFQKLMRKVYSDYKLGGCLMVIVA